MKKISKLISAILLAALVLMPNMNALAAELENTEIVELRAPVYEEYPYTETYNEYKGDKLWKRIERGGHVYERYIKYDGIYVPTKGLPTYYYRGALKLVR